MPSTAPRDRVPRISSSILHLNTPRDDLVTERWTDFVRIRFRAKVICFVARRSTPMCLVAPLVVRRRRSMALCAAAFTTLTRRPSASRTPVRTIEEASVRGRTSTDERWCSAAARLRTTSRFAGAVDVDDAHHRNDDVDVAARCLCLERFDAAFADETRDREWSERHEEGIRATLATTATPQCSKRSNAQHAVPNRAAWNRGLAARTPRRSTASRGGSTGEDGARSSCSCATGPRSRAGRGLSPRAVPEIRPSATRPCDGAMLASTSERGVDTVLYRSEH